MIQCLKTHAIVDILLHRIIFAQKKDFTLEQFSKGQFYKNTVYLERGMPYFALSEKTDGLFVAYKKPSPAGEGGPR